jgi:uncharacterized DUF497 family protein
MDAIRFVWDEKKNEANRGKHGVSFEEARTVFFDEDAIQFFDEPHSGGEDRFLMLGLSSSLRLLLVSHTFRERESVIRIISARRATKREGRVYLERSR